jgi:hypothetical protein
MKTIHTWFFLCRLETKENKEPCKKTRKYKYSYYDLHVCIKQETGANKVPYKFTGPKYPINAFVNFTNSLCCVQLACSGRLDAVRQISEVDQCPGSCLVHRTIVLSKFWNCLSIDASIFQNWTLKLKVFSASDFEHRIFLNENHYFYLQSHVFLDTEFPLVHHITDSSKSAHGMAGKHSF